MLPLTQAFLADIARSLGRPVAGLTQEAKRALAQHRWPGNVRELENALQRAVILSDGSPITAEHLSLDGSGGAA
ncbi:MAG: sigma-54-dependent Fis family transcriptional regulator, partial [Gemmatimonadaceae bacterium]|nr:sigma-54-dependent Fis family transcriptional regulator [Gemmatimonadaceae bacterium]